MQLFGITSQNFAGLSILISEIDPENSVINGFFTEKSVKYAKWPIKCELGHLTKFTV